MKKKACIEEIVIKLLLLINSYSYISGRIGVNYGVAWVWVECKVNAWEKLYWGWSLFERGYEDIEISVIGEIPGIFIFIEKIRICVLLE